MDGLTSEPYFWKLAGLIRMYDNYHQKREQRIWFSTVIRRLAFCSELKPIGLHVIKQLKPIDSIRFDPPIVTILLQYRKAISGPTDTRRLPAGPVRLRFRRAFKLPKSSDARVLTRQLAVIIVSPSVGYPKSGDGRPNTVHWPLSSFRLFGVPDFATTRNRDRRPRSHSAAADTTGETLRPSPRPRHPLSTRARAPGAPTTAATWPSSSAAARARDWLVASIGPREQLPAAIGATPCRASSWPTGQRSERKQKQTIDARTLLLLLLLHSYAIIRFLVPRLL